MDEKKHKWKKLGRGGGKRCNKIAYTTCRLGSVNVDPTGNEDPVHISTFSIYRCALSET